jgi:coronin-1B/1C/6
MAGKAPSSKYKYLNGVAAQPTECIGGINVGAVSPDSNVIKSNITYIAVPWKIPGAIGVVPTSTKGTIPEEIPLISQEEAINEINFNPFNDHLIAAASADGAARLYTIPEGGLTKDISTPTATLSGHSKRLMYVDWHPLVNNVLITGTNDEVKLWDVSAESVATEFPKVYKGQVTSVAWNYDGSVCATASKDKALRVVDPRSSAIAGEVTAHGGAKGWRAVWCGKNERIASVGFTKGAERELALWDPRALAKAINVTKLDVSPAAPLPFYDVDTGVLYLGSKGEGAIKLYEVTDSGFVYLSDYKSNAPAAGMSVQPKATVDVMKCEVARFYKLTAAGQVIPLRFEVPRANLNLFHDDLFPDTFDGKPVSEAPAWLAGENHPPALRSIKP